jgi:hypothetical protein
LARKPDAIAHEQRFGRVFRACAITADDGRHAWHGTRAERLDILLRQHADDTWRGARSFDIEGANPRVCVRTSDETGECLAGKVQVVRVLTMPRHEADVFRAAHGLPNAETHHASCVFANSRK